MLLRKIQQLPEKKRKIILWSILAVVALAMIVWLVNNIRETLLRYGGQ